MEQLAKDYEALYQSQRMLQTVQMAKIRNKGEIKQGLQPLGDLLREVLQPGQKISLVAMASLLKSLQPVTSIAEYMKAEMNLEMARKRMKKEDPRIDEVIVKPMDEDLRIGDMNERVGIRKPQSVNVFPEDLVGLEDVLGTPRAPEAGSEADEERTAFRTVDPSTIAGLSLEDKQILQDLQALLSSKQGLMFKSNKVPKRAAADLDAYLSQFAYDPKALALYATYISEVLMPNSRSTDKIDHLRSLGALPRNDAEVDKFFKLVRIPGW